MENNNNNINIGERGKRKTDQLSLPKRNLAETWVASSPPKGESPAKAQKIQKLVSTSPDSSEDSSYASEPSILEEGNHVVPDIPVQIIAAKPMQLLTDTRKLKC